MILDSNSIEETLLGLGAEEAHLFDDIEIGDSTTEELLKELLLLLLKEKRTKSVKSSPMFGTSSLGGGALDAILMDNPGQT